MEKMFVDSDYERSKFNELKKYYRID
jgi:hypothetical protein